MRERKFAAISQSLAQVLLLIPEAHKRMHSIRYPDPAIKVNDTVKIDLTTGKIADSIHFDTGAIAMVTGGRNMGRVGVITHRERHDGGFNIVHIKDAVENSFATRESNVFVIGSEKPWISLPKGKGVKVSSWIRRVKIGMLTQIPAINCRGKRPAPGPGHSKLLITGRGIDTLAAKLMSMRRYGLKSDISVLPQNRTMILRQSPELLRLLCAMIRPIFP